VEASSTPTIRRLIPSCRHQLSPIAPRAILAAIVTTVSVAYANAQQFQATLSGFNEVPLALFSAGQGTLTLHLNRQQQSLTYTLTYSNLGSVTQAHIHFGKVHVAGGIMVFLCSNLANPPVATPPCPPSGPVMGMLTAGSVLGLPGQNLTAGDFDKLAAALLSDTAYGNVHTTQFPAGEIRGQIRGPDNQNQQR
jgi:CHRD domain